MSHRSLTLFGAALVVLALLAPTPSGLQAQTGPVSVGECAARAPDVAALDGGGFVAVWVEDAQIPDSEFFGQVIWGRLFDSAGNPQGPRMRLAPTVRDPVAVRVVPSEDGGFLIAFAEGGEDLRIVDFAPDGALRNDFLLGDWNRPTPTLAAGADDFLSVVSTASPVEVETLRFRASGEVQSTAILREDGAMLLSQPTAAVLAGGDSAIAYLRVSDFPSPDFFGFRGTLRLQRLGAGGTPVGDPRTVTDDVAHVDMDRRPEGGLVLVYLQFAEMLSSRSVVAEVLDPELQTIERIEVDEVRSAISPTVSVSPDGSTLTVGWRQEIQPAPGSPNAPRFRLVARTFGLDGTPRSVTRTLATDLPREEAPPNQVLHPRLTHLDPSRLAAAWWNQATVLPPVIGGCTISLGAFVDVVDALPTCPGDSLCLQDERFAVRVTWEDPRSGDSGVGTPSPVTDDTGTFWFFDEQNLELMVKVLDARPVNGHFWVFFGSLTDVEFELTVTDLATGAERTYTNPPFEMASRADTTAFDGAP